MTRAPARLSLPAMVLLAAGPARAFVCSRAVAEAGETGPALSWTVREVTYALHADGSDDLPGLDEHAILEAAFAVWNNVTSCGTPAGTSDFHFVRGPDSHEDVLIGFNHLEPETNANLVVFRDQSWPLRDENRNAVALTTTTYAWQTGEIYDADIEFNSSDIDFVDANHGCTAPQMDLMNTAVHEIGHVLGLDHPDELDDHFANAYDIADPNCTSQATMCYTATSCETDKRSLACDDRDGVVFKYPSAGDNGTCAQPECASGRPACGECSEADCQAWRDCGFCAPPASLARVPTVTSTGYDDGMGCACHGGGPSLLPLLLVALRRRRRSG